MPWTKQDSPANALLDEGYSEDRAIPIAIAQARRWAEEDHEEKTASRDSSS